MPELIHFSDPLPVPVEDRPSAERCIGIAPLRTTWSRYESGAMDCGEWACEPGAWKIAFHEEHHEFFHVLAGRLRIHDETGVFREFGPGDAGVIPAGFTGIFEVIEPVRKRYVMIDGQV
ncbi:MAG: DUF861 domain-containing protein [Proteobacteria bacterium]|nr:DUF861 domain-containing protein [Pseudomonadota bacterium]HQR05081.1 cupin domain-containing protein [Rhodocyclaceae bacterium]